MDLRTRQLSTQSDRYQVSHRYSYFSWWWTHSHPKHVEKRNKCDKKIVHQVGFTRLYEDERSTKHKKWENFLLRFIFYTRQISWKSSMLWECIILQRTIVEDPQLRVCMFHLSGCLEYSHFSCFVSINVFVPPLSF